MSAKLKVDLFADPIYKINDVREYITSFAEDVKVASELVVQDLTEEGSMEAWFINASAPRSGLTPSVVEHKYRGQKGEISLTGENAVYDEFGTGDEGLWNPHPLKDEFGLNPYNSGPTIFYNQFAGRNQWFYRPMAGQPYFDAEGRTSGIPSGKQMYGALVHINGIKNDVISKHLNEAIHNLK